MEIKPSFSFVNGKTSHFLFRVTQFLGRMQLMFYVFKEPKLIKNPHVIMRQQREGCNSHLLLVHYKHTIIFIFPPFFNARGGEFHVEAEF